MSTVSSKSSSSECESKSNASQCTTTNSSESKEQCELDISATEQAMEGQTRENVEEQLPAIACSENSENSGIKVGIASFGKYPTDPAHFRDIKINSTVRSEIVKIGPCKPNDEVFPKDASNGSFHQSRFTKNNVTRDWLVYSMKEHQMFCFCCWPFPRKSDKGYENNWSELGV